MTRLLALLLACALASPALAAEPWLTSATPFDYVCLSGRGSPEQVPEACARLQFLVHWYHLRTCGPIFAALDADRWEVGQAVHPDQPGIGPLVHRRFEWPLLATTLRDVAGPAADDHAALRDWARERGFALFAAPVFEFYVGAQAVVAVPVTTRPGSGDRTVPPPCLPWNVVRRVPSVTDEP